jgi:two-component system chemotaxis family response regulator WspR
MTIFAVDDDESELELLGRVLEAVPNIDFEVHNYTDADRALIDFMNHEAELIFLDYQLGGVTAIDLLEQMRRIGDQRPAIVLTGRGDEYAAAELTRAGADDYIVKSDLNVDMLRTAIARALAAYAKRLSEAEVVKHAFELERANEQLARAKRELEEMNARLVDISDTDPVAEIPNRRHFFTAGERELARTERSGTEFSLALLDVDRYSAICDRHGKAVGEKILRKIAETLKLKLRSYDLIARLDGQTFGILFPETELANAASVADRCRRAIESLSLPLESTGAHIGVTVSGGVTCSAVGTNNKLDSMIQAADKALRRARKAGGNRVDPQETS